MIITINPYTENEIQSYSVMTGSDVDTVVGQAQASQRQWKTEGLAQRADLLLNLSRILQKKKRECATLISTEMGKPILQAQAEVEKCVWVCEHYAQFGPELLQDRPQPVGSSKASVVYDPLGLVLAIMPWNFPFWQVFRFAVPSLLAGNGVLLKHAPNSTGVALKIEDLILEAGFPENLFRTLIIDVDQVGPLIRDSRVAGVTLTGSTRAGASVAQIAGEALKKSVLELGGCDPYLVLPDADVSLAARVCVQSRLNNAGQTCIAAKRWLVCPEVYDEFKAAVLEELQAYRAGDPFDPQTTLGPLARADLRDGVKRQVEQARSGGDQTIWSSSVPDRGFFFPVTVFDEVNPDSILAREEVFGPVVCLMKPRYEKQAVTWANDSEYGLGAAVFSRDLERAQRLARELHVGSVALNGLVKSDPRLPFGGVKRSGYGRELGEHGLYEFVNVKTVTW